MLNPTLSLFAFRKEVIYFFFFNDTAPTEIYPLPLHDALPISDRRRKWIGIAKRYPRMTPQEQERVQRRMRSEEHTSELQSRLHLVCRLLLEKKKKGKKIHGIGRPRAEADYAL